VLFFGAVSFSILMGKVFITLVPNEVNANLLAGFFGTFLGLCLGTMIIYIFYLEEPYDSEYPNEYYWPLNTIGMDELGYYKEILSDSWKAFYSEEKRTAVTKSLE